MAKHLSARELGDLVGVPHLEVIRRIRKGDIHAEKVGWNWIVESSEVERIKGSDWYVKYRAKHEVKA